MSTNHRLPPLSILWRFRHGCSTRKASSLLITRQNNTDRRRWNSVWPLWGMDISFMMGQTAFQVSALAASAFECQHHKADDTVQENNGSQDDDQDHGDGESAALDLMGDGKGEIWKLLIWLDPNKT